MSGNMWVFRKIGSLVDLIFVLPEYFLWEKVD